MNFLYCHILCVFILPIQGHISFAFLRSPESSPDKVDLRIDGSIDLSTNWSYSDVRDSINEIGRSLGQYKRDMAQNTREVQWSEDDKSDNRQINNKRDIMGQGRQDFWASSGKSDKRDTMRNSMSDNKDAAQRDSEYAWEDETDKKDNAQWDDLVTSDNDNIPRQGGEASEASDNRDIVPHKRQKEGILGVTLFGTTLKTTVHKVKDVARTKEFSIHLFKQTMQVFDSIKRKMGDSDMKAKVDDMARSYKDQFRDFVRRQRETSVRTKMGDQRAILHTMDTSNMILQRLVNFLKADMEEAGLRSTDKKLQKDVDVARELEYKHVCSKYGYCRSGRGFTTMLENCIKTLISADDDKMYQARDSLTEVLKNGDFSKLIDSKTDKSFKKKINKLEKMEPQDLREALRVLLGMLSNAQTPLVVDEENTEVVKKTVAFYTLLAMWEDVMPGDEANKLEWADIENSLGDWSRGKRTDVHEIIKALERNMKRGFKKIDPDTEVKMKAQVKIIRG